MQHGSSCTTSVDQFSRLFQHVSNSFFRRSNCLFRSVIFLQNALLDLVRKDILDFRIGRKNRGRIIIILDHIRNDLEMLFTRITLRYKSDIRMVEFKMNNARDAFAFGAFNKLETLKHTYEEHLTEIENMKELLDVDDPKMTTMIESYRRGFMKGVTAATLNFIENK